MPPDIDKSIGDEKTMGPEPGSGGGYTLSPGQTLGQYKIIRALGRGGMGEVYEVEHQVLRRRYALKLLPTNFARQPGALDRFQREAQVMANLEHPNIVKVDDFGEAGGRYWLRMELANGVARGDAEKAEKDRLISLQDLADTGGGKIKQETLAGILAQILSALEYAHGKGAVHRDLKPSNILIFNDDADGASFKIADFGLVRLVGEEWVRSQAQISVQRSMSMGDMQTMRREDADQGTSTRSMLGTFEYMSPEQKRGEDVTPQSDLYSVGLMAFKLLAGRNPGLKPPSRIDPELAQGWDELLEKAIEESPADRCASVGEMQAGLAGITTAMDQDRRQRQFEQGAERERVAAKTREREDQEKRRIEAERWEKEAAEQRCMQDAAKRQAEQARNAALARKEERRRQEEAERRERDNVKSRKADASQSGKPKKKLPAMVHAFWIGVLVLGGIIWLASLDNTLVTTMKDSSPHAASPLGETLSQSARKQQSVQPPAPMPASQHGSVTGESERISFSKLLSNVQSQIDIDNIGEARRMLLDILDGTEISDQEKNRAERLLGQVNIELVTTPRRMDEKIDYTLQGGDSIASIARRYGTTVELVQRSNRIANLNLIRVGQRLRILNKPFSIHIDVARNDLVLQLDGRFFKVLPELVWDF